MWGQLWGHVVLESRYKNILKIWIKLKKDEKFFKNPLNTVLKTDAWIIIIYRIKSSLVDANDAAVCFSEKNF